VFNQQQYPVILWFDVFLKIECTLKGYKHIATRTQLIRNLDDNRDSFNLNNSNKPAVFPENTNLYHELTQIVPLKVRLNFIKNNFSSFVKITLKTIYMNIFGWITHKDMIKNFKLLK
jgi:hypothetical protein